MRKAEVFTAVLTAALTLCFFVVPKSSFSENENRYLQTFPEISVRSIKNGDLTEGLGDYVSDHFPFRNFFLNMNSVFETAVLGKREINGVYVCRDGYFIEKYKEPESTEEIIGIINSFDEKTDANIYLTLVPTAFTLYEDKLPAFAPKGGQLEALYDIYDGTDVKEADVYDVLNENRDKKLYYRLDHHWTTEGAYIAYRKIISDMGFEPYDRDAFDRVVVTEDFKGTVYSKVLLPNIKGESIEVWKNDEALRVKYADTGEETDSLYNYEFLNKKDKYSLFLDNIHTLTEITNENAESERSLAVIKDSYANCMIQFLTGHFKKIYVFDTRYYKGSVSEFINEKGISDVLFLYNMNTIDDDLGIRAVY